MSFANQALSAEFILNNHSKLGKDVYKVPDDIDQKVAKLKLDSMSIEIDTLTPEQIAYMSSWEHGT
jgi:adenosylhomocysteinase (EC 3.3.1.1)